MKKEALFHLQDSSYCFPTSKTEITIRLRCAKEDLQTVEILYESKYVIGKSHKSLKMEKRYSGELFDWYEAKLTLEDPKIAYVFYVYDGKEAFYFSEDGLTKEYDFTLGYYNFFQYPYINENDIVKPIPWMAEASFYQIFVDRFARGDMNKSTDYINMKWGDTPKPKSFAGGDLKGIIQNLDYIQSLGMDSLYLTPIFESISNHKYDISDYYKIDPMFGDLEDLKELVSKTHERGMHIVLDAVFNHCSEKFFAFQDVLEKGKDSIYFDWFVIRGDKVDQGNVNYETFASCSYMPKLNTANPALQKYFLDVAVYYIKEIGIDGWRLDVSDEVSHEFWREFRKAIKEVNPNAVIIGENWHDASTNLRGDEFDSIMNYAFTKLVLDYIAWEKKDAKAACEKLNEILVRNKDGINKMMLNLLDSHDTHRIFSEVGCKETKLKAALALLYFFPGASCVFYGTEVYTQGGYDPDCRRCMDFDKAKEDEASRELICFIQKLNFLKKEKKLSEAEFYVSSEKDLLILENRFVNGSLYLVLNMTDKELCYKEKRVRSKGFLLIDEKGGVLYE